MQFGGGLSRGSPKEPCIRWGCRSQGDRAVLGVVLPMEKHGESHPYVHNSAYWSIHAVRHRAPALTDPKLPCLGSGFTDQHEIWQSDVPAAMRPLDLIFLTICSLLVT